MDALGYIYLRVGPDALSSRLLFPSRLPELFQVALNHISLTSCHLTWHILHCPLSTMRTRRDIRCDEGIMRNNSQRSCHRWRCQWEEVGEDEFGEESPDSPTLTPSKNFHLALRPHPSTHTAISLQLVNELNTVVSRCNSHAPCRPSKIDAQACTHFHHSMMLYCTPYETTHAMEPDRLYPDSQVVLESLIDLLPYTMTGLSARNCRLAKNWIADKRSRREVFQATSCITVRYSSICAPQRAALSDVGFSMSLYSLVRQIQTLAGTEEPLEAPTMDAMFATCYLGSHQALCDSRIYKRPGCRTPFRLYCHRIGAYALSL